MNATLQDTLLKLASGGGKFDLLAVLLGLGVSLAASAVLLVIYLFCYARKDTGAQIHRAFLLIGPATTALFICIQYSLPLSLGLLGALSFVRFRTPIKDPEEVGYLLCLIAISVAAATNNFVILAVLIVLAAGVSYVWRLAEGAFARDSSLGHLFVTGKPGDVALDELQRMLGGAVPGLRLVGTSQTADSIAFHFTFGAIDPGRHANVVDELKRLPSALQVNMVLDA